MSGETWIMGLWPREGLGAEGWWIILAAALCSLACGLTGVYLVLRRLSMLGDAISHAILPGLAGAFLLTGTRDIWAMLIGAGLVGLLTAVGASVLRRVGRVQDDAALGVVFTSLFALGVLMISWTARQIDLDPGCVLYGLLEFTPFDTRTILGAEVPRVVVTLSVTLAVVVAIVSALFKEIRLVAFDPGLATSMGISALLVHGLMLAMTAGVTVVSFEAVGSILVVTMLIAPGATAHLLTDRFGRMYLIAGLAAISAAVLGYLLALRLNTSVAGMISVVAGGQFVMAAVLGPRYGIVARGLRRGLLTLRICREDILGMLYRWHEEADRNPNARPLRLAEVLDAIRAPRLGRLAVAALQRRGQVALSHGGQLRLTPLGRGDGSRVVRTHRLWELYLARHLSLPTDHLHAPAHRVEHFITPALEQRLTREIGSPAADPHGRPIPPPSN